MLIIIHIYVLKPVPSQTRHGDKTQLGYVNITVQQDSSIMIREFVLISVLQLWEEMDLFQIVECVTGPV